MEKLQDNSKLHDAEFQDNAELPSKKSLFSFSRLINKFRNRTSFREKISQLTVSQWFYFAASILFIFKFKADYQAQGIALVGVIAGIGLFRELWQLFLRVWDKTLGKGVLLVLYAATANFALAISALKINAVAGIEPTPFIFTLGFTTLLMLPFWLTTATAVFFSMAIVVLNLWLLVSIVLRLVRIKIQVHWEDRSFLFLTMIMRLLLIPAVIVTLSSIITPYVNQIESQSGQFKIFNALNIADDPLQSIQGVNEDKPIVIAEDVEKATSTDEGKQPSVEPKPIRYLDRLVATFIFWFETYPYSACVKADNQRSLIIDDYSMLVVERDESELGFKFSVLPCIAKYKGQENVN